MITILLADDHPMIRRGLMDMLKGEENYTVVGEASNGLETLEMVHQLKPDVLVLDLRMPHLSGLDVLKRLRQSGLNTKVIILSMYGSEPYVLEALRIGAEGFVVKDSVPSEIVKALDEVSNGRRYISQSLSEFVINAYIRKSEEIALDSMDTLTPREREVLQHAGEGMSNTEIAAHLSISSRTVEVHRLNLMRKLGLRNQGDLIRYAVRKGFVNIDTTGGSEID